MFALSFKKRDKRETLSYELANSATSHVAVLNIRADNPLMSNLQLRVIEVKCHLKDKENIGD